MPKGGGVRKPLSQIRKGEVIEAKFLNNVVNDVNDLTALAVKLPKQVNEPNPENADAVAPADFVETSRAVEEVQIFDQNATNYALIDRMTRVEFANSAGDTLVLVFNNPVVVPPAP